MISAKNEARTENYLGDVTTVVADFIKITVFLLLFDGKTDC